VSLDNIHTSMGDFNEKELDLAVNTPERNILIVQKYQEHVSGKRAVAFCVTVSHAQALAYAFNEQGIYAAVIEGNTPLDERARIYKAFRAGEIRVLCNVMVLTEGWDEPLCEVAIMARPTQSRGLFTQQFGRILRPAPGKKHATVLDITDNSYRLRLTPQTLRSVIGKQLQPDETLLDTLAREESEKEEKEAAEKRVLIRKLNEKRDTDKIVNLFALPEWQERENGMFVLEVGIERHRIALVPCQSSGFAQLYDVWAKLAPTFDAQPWMKAQPLDWAMQYAEKRARQLLEDPKSRVLMDQGAPWRNAPMTEGQKKFLIWKKIPWTDMMTKGEASNLIEAWKTEDAKKKAAKAARDAERAEQQKENDDPPGNLYSNQGFSLMR
jgi:superfamily II DNA/RNA helicase